MLIVQICVGSSCHLKGSETIVQMLEAAIAEHHIEDEVVLTGSFCIGKCNKSTRRGYFEEIYVLLRMGRSSDRSGMGSDL